MAEANGSFRPIADISRPLHHITMQGLRLITLAAVLFSAGGCTDWEKKFSRECKAAATVQINDRDGWRSYLVRLKPKLSSMRKNVGENTPLRDPPDVGDFTLTEGFDFTNNWVLRGRPPVKSNDIYENDYFVIDTQTGKKVARIGNLSLSTPSIGHTKTWDCIYNYPRLYRRQLS